MTEVSSDIGKVIRLDKIIEKNDEAEEKTK